MGGGDLYDIAHLSATELSTLCPNPNNCKITTPQSEITNHGTFTSSSLIEINAPITHFTNYGTISGGIFNSGVDNALAMITNYGEMRGVWAYQEQNITINNLGIMKAALGSYFTSNSGVAHFVFEASEGHLTIENFMIPINESQNEFNNFTGYTDKVNNKNSHLMVWGQGSNFVSFKDSNSKLILDFDKGFELGKEYKISKLVTDKSGTSVSALNVDFGRLTTRTSLYKLTQNGEYFIASIDAPNSEIGILHKSNVRTMNNFMTMSNAMIYPRKYSKSQNLGRKNSSLQHSPSLARGNSNTSPSLAEGARGWVEYPSLLDSAFSLKSYESFAYQNESQNLQTRRIQRQNKRNYSRSVKDSSLRADSQNLRGNLQINKEQNYYFILTPFINHNYFFESGRYNLSGFDGGFLTAFSAKVAESNSLGAHFMMSYGSLNDSHDKDFRISNLNLNLGLNYKLDLAWDMYLKARGDFFYFLNQVKTLTMREAIKPNNLGFGVSVSYGKEWDFRQGGTLGIEGGIDYKALSASEITLDSMNETYKKSLYHLLYLDLGLTYAKYFGNFGFNANLGIKGNITANKLAKSQISLNNFNRSVDMILDNDKILGYTNMGVSYVLNAKNFDMEFSLAYYGNFGDRVISNGGGFEWRAFF